MKRKTLVWPLIAVIGANIAQLTSCTQEPVVEDVFQIMSNDYRTMLLECVDTSAYDDMTVDQIKSLLTWEEVVVGEQHAIGYKFKELKYDDDDTAWWPPHQHLRRTTMLSVLGIKTNNQEIINISLRLLRFWLGKHFTNTNWWFGMIGVPQELTNIVLLLGDKLNDNEKAIAKQHYGKGTFKYNPETHQQTGTNLYWVADISLKSGLFDRDQSQIDEVVDLVRNEIVMHHGDGEGFQDDGSYFQHGNQLYNGGYGRQGVLTLCRILSAFNHQDFPLTDEQVDIMNTFPLDGMKYFTHKGYVNYQTLGRTYTRKDSGLITAGVTDLGNMLEFKTLAKFEYCPRKDELDNLLSSWENKTSTFSGIKYFPHSCMITMNIDDVYMSFRGTKPGLINTEKANNENFLGFNQSYGTTTCVMSTGKEYFDISPVWNYSSIPGTTCLDEDDPQLSAYDDEDFKAQVVGRVFNGGYDNINNLAFSMQQGKKNFNNFVVTCFATNDGMVLLGAELKNDRRDPLHTTVEQCIVQEEPIIAPDNKSVKHGNVLYTNLDDSTTFITKVDEVRESWTRNNRSQKGDATENVLTIRIDHPTNQTTYAYAIQPVTKQDAKFVVISNSVENQAILLPNNKIAAAFYRNSSFMYKEQKYDGKEGEFKIFDVK